MSPPCFLSLLQCDLLHVLGLVPSAAIPLGYCPPRNTFVVSCGILIYSTSILFNMICLEFVVVRFSIGSNPPG